MKQVWKCDFCSQTNVDFNKIEEHETKCSFNSINKKCYTCKFSTEDGYGEHIGGCEIGLDTFDGEFEGNCKGWVDENLEENRDIKLEAILNQI